MGMTLELFSMEREDVIKILDNFDKEVMSVLENGRG
jgi:hypothetical protein